MGRGIFGFSDAHPIVGFGGKKVTSLSIFFKGQRQEVGGSCTMTLGGKGEVSESFLKIPADAKQKGDDSDDPKGEGDGGD